MQALLWPRLSALVLEGRLADRVRNDATVHLLLTRLFWRQFAAHVREAGLERVVGTELHSLLLEDGLGRCHLALVLFKGVAVLRRKVDLA